jgi:hypothetical protein
MGLDLQTDTNVRSIRSSTNANPGEHLASIFEAHGREIVPKADDALISKCSEHLRDLQLGPQLITANIVEDRFGAQEAARYALALLQGEAR